MSDVKGQRFPLDTSNPANLLIAGIYYVLTVIISFLSIFGVYILLRYGKSQALSLTVSIVYSILFLTLLQISYSTLQTL